MKLDAILDTDTYNEVDDQFALSYALLSKERINLKAVYAAPFFNSNSSSPEDGMNKSYDEILKILDLGNFFDMKDRVYKGSDKFLPDENTPVISEAAKDLVRLAGQYTKENPLYVIALGAITNIASAILMDSHIADKIVIVWLGGNAIEFSGEYEFNMSQDIAAARIVFSSGARLVLLPCKGVVSSFALTGPELDYWLKGKNPLCDYLIKTVKTAAEAYASGRVWSRTIWDVTAVAWLLNDNDIFMESKTIQAIRPEYDNTYTSEAYTHKMDYVTYIKRDNLMQDLFDKLGSL